jgi:predicted phosphodiesterase
MIAVCKKKKIKNIIIAGDFFDELAFSPFTDYDKLNWVDEKGYAREVGDIIFKTFKQVKFITGNHDIRCFKRLKAKGDVYGIWDEVFKREDTKNFVSMYSHCKLHSGDKKWHITHPQYGTKTDYGLRELMAIHPGYNVIAGHSHINKRVQDASGTVEGIYLGGMIAPEKIGWKQRRDDLRFKWHPSFAVIEDGYADVFYKDFTNWGRILGSNK